MATLSVTRDETAKVDRQAPLSDAESAAQAALVGAISFTAQKMHLNHAEATIALKQNDRDTYGYFKYGLAAQIAEHIAEDIRECVPNSDVLVHIEPRSHERDDGT